MALTTTNLFRDFVSLRDAMDRVLDDRWIDPGAWLTWPSMGAHYLPLDVYETPDSFVVRVEAPGASSEDIDVEYEQGRLTLRVRTETPAVEDGATWLIREIGSGQAMRQITLPRAIDVDQAQSTFENGVLTLTLPKTPDARPKQIKVEPVRQLGVGAAAETN